jgi:hypothetical protein
MKPRSKHRGSAQRGRDTENRVKDVLEADGWLVASRRHYGGAGDLLAVRWDDEVPDDFRGQGLMAGHTVRLIEVKSTAGGPYEGFRTGDRYEMLHAAATHNAEPWLAWWPPLQDQPRWIPASEWPVGRSRTR